MYSFFCLSEQANLVAAFEQSLALMTTRLQSLSMSQEQKVTSHPHFQTQTHTNVNTSCIPPRCGQLRAGSVVLTWSKVTLITACSMQLNVG